MATQTQSQPAASQTASVGSRWVLPPPAGMLGSAIIRDPRFGRGPGVYPIKVVGTYVLLAGQTFVAPINLCYIPPNSILTDFKIFGPAAMQPLRDTLPTPTVYCTSFNATNVTTWADVLNADGGSMGTMYATTPRAAGPQGTAVVQWQPGITLVLGGATPGVGTVVRYMLEFSPVYDAGV